MADEWAADIPNDPRYEYELCVELSYGGEHRMTLRRSSGGQLIVEVYPRGKLFEVPADWLRELLSRAERELPLPEAKKER